MASTISLLDWILSILRDPDERAVFQHNPDAYADHHGFGELSPADVHDALVLIADNQPASYDHELSVHYPPPEHYDNHTHAAHYLNHYISNNYRLVDEHDTTIDNSVHQKIHTDGGDLDQHIDNDPVVASGDDSVATGGDLRDSRVTTGHDNVIGDDDRAVTGEDDTTAFGRGNVDRADFDRTDFDQAHLDQAHFDQVDFDPADFDRTHFGHGSAVAPDGDADGHAGGEHGATGLTLAGDHADAHQFADQSDTDDSRLVEHDDHHDVDLDSNDRVDTEDSLGDPHPHH